jgi:hypothetical protein
MRLALRSLVALAMLASAGTGAFAGPLTVGDMIRMSDGPGTTGGGEFRMRSVAGSWDEFITFCLQRTEYIDFTNQFRIGGISTFASSDPVANGGQAPSGNDPLSWQTAYLYTQFRNNTLYRYDYDNDSDTSAAAGHDYDLAGGRTGSANMLQTAFWMFENELPMDTSNFYVGWANGAVARGEWALYDIGNVRALNLYYGTTMTEAQDQLALAPTPVPEPATLTLVGSGALMLLARRRRANRRKRAMITSAAVA